MKKYTVLFITLIGILIGILGGTENFAVMLGIVFAVAFGGMILVDCQKATYFIGAYSFIDFLLRTFIGGLAGIWDELFLVVLILLWGYKWIIFRKEECFKQTPLDLPVIAFIVTMLFCFIVRSPDNSIAFEGFRAVVQYILWYFVVLQLLKTENGARNVCLVFVLVCGIIAIHGVYQYVVGVEMPAGWVDQNEAGVRTRVYSILGSPNIMGSLMTLATPICVAFAITGKDKFKKILFAFLAVMMLGSLVFTFSRGAWIGFAVAVGVYVLLKDKRLIVPAIIFALLVVLLVPSVGTRIAYMLSPEYIESSLKGGRLVRWWTGLQILESNPLFGVGLGHFGGAVAMNNGLSTVVGANVVKTYYMDNYFLKTAVETGIVGLAMFVVLMYQIFISSVRTIKITLDKSYKELEIGILAGLVGVIIHNLVENVFEVPMMTSCFWLLVAVMMHLWYINYKKHNNI